MSRADLRAQLRRRHLPAVDGCNMPRVGFRVVLGEEARRQTIEVDRYLDTVSQEVHASHLSPAAQRAFDVFYQGYRNNVQDVVNASWLDLNLNSAAISDRAESARDQGREWASRARAAGGPNLSGTGPSLPGEGPGTNWESVAKWGAVAIVGVVALQAIKALKS